MKAELIKLPIAAWWVSEHTPRTLRVVQHIIDSIESTLFRRTSLHIVVSTRFGEVCTKELDGGMLLLAAASVIGRISFPSRHGYWVRSFDPNVKFDTPEDTILRGSNRYEPTRKTDEKITHTIVMAEFCEVIVDGQVWWQALGAGDSKLFSADETMWLVTQAIVGGGARL